MSDSPTTVLEINKANKQAESPFLQDILCREDFRKSDKGLDPKEKSKEPPETKPAAMILGNFEIVQAPKVGDAKLEAQPRADVAAMDMKNFAEVAKKVLAKIEPSGYVTKDQLAKALEDPSFKGTEAQALAAMYKNFDKLHNLSKHEWAWNSASITAGDLDKFQEKVNKRELDLNDSFSMKTWAQTGVKRFASDGEILTASDISKALANPNTSANDKQMLRLVEKHFDEVSQRYGLPLLGSKGATLADFSTYGDKVWAGSDEAKMVRAVNSTVQGVAENGQNASIDYNLYAAKNPLESIRPDAIRQGTIGDCYFESALAAVAVANPQAIRDAIKDNHDGTYTVTFPGASGEPITVKAPTQAELGLYNGGSNLGVWAAVVEKAYGKYRDNHAWVGSYTPQEAADGGGRPEPVIELLTGHKAVWKEVGKDQGEVARNLEAAFASNPAKAVTAGVYGDARIWDLLGYATKQTADKFYKGHEYTITAFKPDGHGGGTVTIRNPWGGTTGTVDGTIQIPLDKFMKNFSSYSIQGK